MATEAIKTMKPLVSSSVCYLALKLFLKEFFFTFIKLFDFFSLSPIKVE